MLIKKFFVPLIEAEQLGLQEINMQRLGRFVAIAGKNGAGKSRLLDSLQALVTERFNESKNLPAIRENVKNLKSTIDGNEGNHNIPSWRKTLDIQEKKIETLTNRVITDEGAIFKSLRFVPKNLNMPDPRTQPQHQLFQLYSQAASAAVDGYGAQCLAYIQQSQNRWWNASHQNFMGDSEEKNAIIQEYNRLNQLIVSLLGVELRRSVDGYTLIFNKPLADAKLSDGQKINLQLAAAIHAQSGSLDNTVFILDELENHLHPSATIEILERLRTAAPNSQIWIATHSVPLLAYVVSIEPMALWYMDEGLITHAGRHPQKVLKSLLGDDVRIGQLSSFAGLPAQLAATNYAAESLMPPVTMVAENSDPQISQISKIFRQWPSTPLSVLDFGAGKGRLLEGLGAAIPKEELLTKIEYFALDNSVDDKNLCVSVIAEYFADADARYFSSPDDFFSKKNDKSIDVVIMCNVLHEIPPNSWLQIFSGNSVVMRSLKENGYLLLVEDQRIPVGEKAHEHGFLVLDTPHLKTLFNITEEDIRERLFLQDDSRGDGRLKAHLISKKLLSRISVDSRREAISQLKETALTQIRYIRGQNATYTNGQIHGFWTQQLANSYMYLSENTSA